MEIVSLWCIVPRISYYALTIDREKQCGYRRIRWVFEVEIKLMVDVIKSRLQTDIIGAGRKYSGALDCAIQSYRAEGLGTFFRGIGPTLARAAPVNAMVQSKLYSPLIPDICSI